MIFNIVLIIHFIAFLIFFIILIQILHKAEKILNKHSLLIGITILITGVVLVALKYPEINYYKIIPKSILFIFISLFCGVYSKKKMPQNVYYLLFICTILASLIAVYKV